MPRAQKQPPTSETPREALFARYEAACAEAARKRAASLALRQQYRKDKRRRDAMRAALVADLRRVYEHPDNPYAGWSASRKRYRQLGWYPEVLIEDLFGTHAEFERAAGLRDKRGTSKVLHARGRACSEGKIREYAEHEVMRHVGRWQHAYRRSRGVKHILVGSDFHSRFVDPFALRVWLDVAEMVQPDGIVFNGDVLDFPQISRHPKLPGEQGLSVQEEIDWARKNILRPTIERAPKAFRTWHIGNHEQRMVRAFADSDPRLIGLRSMPKWSDMLEIEELEIELVFGGSWLAPRQRDRAENIRRTWKVYYDSLAVYHGTSIARNSWEVELQRFGMPVTCGHTHRPAVYWSGTLAQPNLSATQTGMLAGFAVGKEYVGHPSCWTMGFALFTIDPASGTVVPQPICISEDFATFCGHAWRPTAAERKERLRQWGEVT